MTVLQGSIDQTRGGRNTESQPHQQKPSPARRAARKPAGKAAKKATARKEARPKTARASAASRTQRSTAKSELRQLSKAEPYQRAAEYDIAGRSKMSREELIDALALGGRRRKKSAA
ncbi:hypothetical protein [Streptomyces sp. NPDC001381]|uniref:hypothetical protein n=1 Tax=Streptomyces sp. NPDC001381 TaxID=3364567 RepID=UPI0036903E70